MSGIAGSVNSNSAQGLAHVRMINEFQGHRGPDKSFAVETGSFTLGQTVLVTNSGGSKMSQPLISADGRYQCVLDGVIYNTSELIERYQLPGRTDRTGSVVPELWAKLGPSSLNQLQGMFSIALVDILEDRLYLARDPFGIKPLHWRTLPDGQIIFASEVWPLFRLAPGARIDNKAVAQYLHLGSLAADQSPFCSIRALPPNSLAVFDRNGRVIIRPILADDPLAQPDAPAEIGRALTDSIRLHLEPDVPMALLLSSGVDSAVIASVARRSGRKLHCLTIATSGDDDESKGAAETALHYGHSHERIPAVLEDDDIRQFFNAMQRPSIDGLNTYLISKAVRTAGYKVALCGLAPIIVNRRMFSFFRWLPALQAIDKIPGSPLDPFSQIFVSRVAENSSKLRRLLEKHGPRDGWGVALLLREVLPASLVSELMGIDQGGIVAVAPPKAGRPSSAACIFAAVDNAIFMEGRLLPDSDAFSMASSVELRVPWVDRAVLWAAQDLVASNKPQLGKMPIAAALDDSYLQRLVSRPKLGFSLPMRQWMTGPLKPILQATNEPSAPLWSIIDRTVAQRAGLVPLRPRERWSETWALAALNAWMDINSE